MNELLTIKANLLKEQYNRSRNDWIYAKERQSEDGKSHYLHRNAFIQDLALDMAANLRLNNSSNFFDDAIAFANTPRCQESLVNYFSSGPFATSQTVNGYKRAYHYFIMQETTELAADFLNIPKDEMIPGYTEFYETLKQAYFQSTHYRDSQLADDNPYKTVAPSDFNSGPIIASFETLDVSVFNNNNDSQSSDVTENEATNTTDNKAADNEPTPSVSSTAP